MQNIIDLCARIEAGYEQGKSGMDNGMIDRVLELSNHAKSIGEAFKELATVRQLIADLCSESQFDHSGTEVESLTAVKDRGREYVRAFLPQHAKDLA
ncbi:MAG: hypothetical protein HYX47_12800 [Burkholderiales bacterium]|nr:hypothetical protein [Burkholderiales bacterium]